MRNSLAFTLSNTSVSFHLLGFVAGRRTFSFSGFESAIVLNSCDISQVVIFKPLSPYIKSSTRLHSHSQRRLGLAELISVVAVLGFLDYADCVSYCILSVIRISEREDICQ